MFFGHFVFSLEKCLFRSFAHFLIVSFLTELHDLFVYFEDVIPYLSLHLQVFSPEGRLLILLMVSFAVQKILSLIRFLLLSFPFVSFTLQDGWRIISLCGPIS